MFVQRYFSPDEIIFEVNESARLDVVKPMYFAWKAAGDGSVFAAFLYSSAQVEEYEGMGFQVIPFDDLTHSYLGNVVFA